VHKLQEKKYINFGKHEENGGIQIRIEQDYTWESRQIRRDLIPYLKESRNKGHRAVIKTDKKNCER
jgi:hypothetical protein